MNHFVHGCTVAMFHVLLKEIPLHHNILKTKHDERSHALDQSFLPWQQLNFNMKIIFMTLVTTTLSVCEGENFDPNCQGALNIFDTSGKEHFFAFSQDGLKKLKILNATVHGCGCFRMHKFDKGRGQSMPISSGDVFTEEDLDFKYIRSVRKEKCNPNAAAKMDFTPSFSS